VEVGRGYAERLFERVDELAELVEVDVLCCLLVEPLPHLATTDLSEIGIL